MASNGSTIGRTAAAGTTTATNTTPDRGAARAQLHGMWAGVARTWADQAEFVDARHANVTRWMLQSTLPQPGERVLELACGPGGPGLAAAARVAPDGEVVLSDVATEMTAVAAARAEALGLGNVRCRPLDLEHIEEPDAAYDVVLCRDGLQFALDPAAAAREIRRVLRPGGRLALAVWGPRDLNPWLGVVLDAATAELGAPVPPPGVPGPFSLGDAGMLFGLLTGAELAQVAISELRVPLRATSFDEWFARTTSLAGPLAKRLASLPAEVDGRLRTTVRVATERYQTPSGLEFPGVALLAAARRGQAVSRHRGGGPGTATASPR
jgi:ubiquinone/menaquinone biosynthesis C-methylase UbiE